MRGLIDLAREQLGDKAAADVERHSREIIAEFGDDVMPYADALCAAADRNRDNPGDLIRSVHGWCMIRAKARHVVSVPAAPQPPPSRPRTVHPEDLKENASIDDIEGAFVWLATGRPKLTEYQVRRFALALCRAFTLDPRGSKYDTAVRGKKLRCTVAFESLCRWLAGGQLSLDQVKAAFIEAMVESQIEPGRYRSKPLGRGLLRRLVFPKVETANAG
jgi:hypothetical protein